ncbi:MAG: DUF4178 domain-containing protein [Labilithrix sp.]|nr:DUF4178 domain-containing protein [Labilithrix sp.]
MSTYEACTVLELGARGKHRGAAFTLAGRACVKSEGGGLWNEWTVAFDDGRRAFLAEALGSFTLFFERPTAPPFEALVVGSPVPSGFIVVERGAAKRVATWGEVPDAPRAYRYADLSSADGERATIDYGKASAPNAERTAAPVVFVGRRVRLSDLALRARDARPRFLPAPAAKAPKGLALHLDVGDEGNLSAGRFRVIGIMHRSIRIEGERYTWEEYVLHAPTEGLRWLVVSDGHWSLVETVEPGLVTEDREKRATFRGQSHRFFSSGKARVEWATGELPWEVAIGDQTSTCDYVRAPHMLSRESSADEITWSYGTYTPPDAVARAFGKRALPKPSGRAPNQPKGR